MRTYILLFLASAMLIAHKLIPFDYTCISCNKMVSLWPFTNIADYTRNYGADLFDKIVHCILIGIIFLKEENKLKEFAFLWLIMNILILIEWILIRNEPWIFIPFIGYKGLSHFFIIFEGIILYKVFYACQKK